MKPYKNVAVILVTFCVFIFLTFYIAILWFNTHPQWQEKDIIYCRKILGKGLKIALSGTNWNQNEFVETIGYLPCKTLQKHSPHLIPAKKLAVVENQKNIFMWSPDSNHLFQLDESDTVTFIPIFNSVNSPKIELYFSNSADTLIPTKKRILECRNHKISLYLP